MTPPRRKYGNTKVHLDNHIFDSKAEASRYQELKTLVKHQIALKRMEQTPLDLSLFQYQTEEDLQEAVTE